ncbi:hypothetical protein [Nostoc sp. PA-18-2419]|uniref:hypothetical protein n=1 Tax=Nostoc sp. PA-18-2419 TaxID=2575443 RepID=UPI001108B5EB|nr:hypothetical protein [Nostoc sp. PA-18-2419]
MTELGIATLTSCFVNSNRDPKSEAAKPSDFFYFTPTEDERGRISSVAANAFFALADAGKLPGWVVFIAPIDKLVKSGNSDPCTPLAWIGEGVVLLQPVVNDLTFDVMWKKGQGVGKDRICIVCAFWNPDKYYKYFHAIHSSTL